jgi:hypothetical protein
VKANGAVDVKLHAFYISVLDDGEWLIYAAAALLSGKVSDIHLI